MSEHQIQPVACKLEGVPSGAYRRWDTIAQKALDEIEAAHVAVGGPLPGRRRATLQVNHAFAMLLSSQFQGYCRDLHSEAVDFAVGQITPASVSPILRTLLLQGRQLDKGNPNPGNIAMTSAGSGCISGQPSIRSTSAIPGASKPWSN